LSVIRLLLYAKVPESPVRQSQIIHMQGSHYDVLGLPTSACLEEIRAAYKKNILSHHPDKSSSDKFEMFQRTKEAWRVLSNFETRKSYDESLNQTSSRLRDRIKFSDLVIDSEQTNCFQYVCRCGCTLKVNCNDLKHKDVGHKDVGEIVIFCDDCNFELTLSS